MTYYGHSRLPTADGRQRYLPGLDETVSGFLLPGHHARAGTPDAFLPHTSSLAWADFRINGQSVGEIGLEACYAGHWDVPLVLVQGDEAGCREAEALSLLERTGGSVKPAVLLAADTASLETELELLDGTGHNLRSALSRLEGSGSSRQDAT